MMKLKERNVESKVKSTEIRLVGFQRSKSDYNEDVIVNLMKSDSEFLEEE